MSNGGINWTEDETVIVYYFYVKNHYSKKKSDIEYLSKLFNRSYGSVDWKFTNVKSLETNGSVIDKKIVSYYSKNKDKLESDAKTALAKFVNKSNKFSQENLLAPKIELKPFIDDSDQLEEGSKITIPANKYERDPKLRLKAINIHGYSCMACGFDFEKVYGELGKDFIEVHHNTPLSKLEGSTIIDPENDLSVLCSNCHRMIHRRIDKILTIAELIKIIKIKE